MPGYTPRRLGTMTAVALALLASDFITKQIALTHFSGTDPTEALGGLLKFTVVFNSGGAFSIGAGETWFFTAVKMVVIAVMLVVAPRIRTPVWAVSFGLVIAGAAGNLIDRLFRAPSPGQGRVVDWIQLPHWPVFNLADCGVVCGSALVMWASTRGIRLDGTLVSKAPTEPDGTEQPAEERDR
ncbi:signal peptidase II [Kitasatospora putterlickiae]|uniref:Lipoprotein signal peptidase n=1 Tax=Kitasatospora putterlickiae TaxID=221725 RepID=A0ABN1YKM8_9ACTN